MKLYKMTYNGKHVDKKYNFKIVKTDGIMALVSPVNAKDGSDVASMSVFSRLFTWVAIERLVQAN